MSFAGVVEKRRLSWFRKLRRKSRCSSFGWQRYTLEFTNLFNIKRNFLPLKPYYGICTWNLLMTIVWCGGLFEQRNL